MIQKLNGVEEIQEDLEVGGTEVPGHGVGYYDRQMLIIVLREKSTWKVIWSMVCF